MAGRIKAEDIATVKERTSIEDVVRDHVTLRPAGVGSLKGLCPFHDEKTPSFTVRPTVGSYHCFGCGEGGDVISFVQKVEHLTFTESIERLAAKLGLELRYEEGGGPREGGMSLGKRSRLIEAHRVAQELYAELLLDTGRPEARAGRDFLRERGFDSAAAATFGIGFAPQGGEALSRHLRERGFTEDEMVTGGLSGRGSRGLYDRFRGRLVWPIRDTTGDTVGFGARRLFDDDRIAAKYLNTSETPIYKKSQVLYGLDAAKKAISTDRRAIVVEGYTDVMAAHLSGVEGAVATCGTAFGVDHIKILRRIMRDETDGPQARVVFTFDGDAAGQKAAMKAFDEDQRWAAQSFVAVAPDGMDPCDLRIARGDAAVRALVDDAVPMFEFAVRTTIRRFDLDTAEGRVQAMKAVAPIIGSIRDTSLRPEYARTVSGWLGIEVEQMAAEVKKAGRMRRDDVVDASRRPAGTDDVPEPEAGEAAATLPAPDPRDPRATLERDVLKGILQYPSSLDREFIGTVVPSLFSAVAYRSVYEAVKEVSQTGLNLSNAAWLSAVAEAAPQAARPWVYALGASPLQVQSKRLVNGHPTPEYLRSLVRDLRVLDVTQRIREVAGLFRRLEQDQTTDPARLHQLAGELADLERDHAAMKAAFS